MALMPMFVHFILVSKQARDNGSEMLFNDPEIIRMLHIRMHMPSEMLSRTSFSANAVEISCWY